MVSWAELKYQDATGVAMDCMAKKGLHRHKGVLARVYVQFSP